jgi:hypothetical protein
MALTGARRSKVFPLLKLHPHCCSCGRLPQLDPIRAFGAVDRPGYQQPFDKWICCHTRGKLHLSPPQVHRWSLHAIAHRIFASRQRRATALRRACVIIGLVVLLFFASASTPRSEESNTDTIVYSEEQAHKGHDLYNEHCASCHGAALEGQGSLPLSGATFRARWADDRHSVDDLFYIVRTLMPYGPCHTG